MKTRENKIAIYLNLIRWDRPVGWLLLLWPTLMALWLAKQGFPGWHGLLVFVLGTILMRSAGCCINDYADKNFDAQVKRTLKRPLVTQKVSSKEVLGIASILALLALGLALTTNLYVVIWAIPAFIITVLYPFSKRYFAMPQMVLGIAFSMGIPMAFCFVNWSGWHWGGWSSFWQVSGGRTMFALLGANLFWVLAYDTEYAMVDRDDDLKIGIKTSAITLGKYDVIAIMCFYIISSLLFAFASYSVIGYWTILAVLLAITQIIWHWQLICGRKAEQCFIAFNKNHWLGFSWTICVVLALL